jgi:hypothetical protein
MVLSTTLFIAGGAALLFIVLGIIFIVVAVNMRRKAAASRTWPTVAGVVTSAEVEESVSSDEDSPTSSFNPKISYSYQVGGVAFQGKKISFGAVNTGSRRAAEQALEPYPVGQPVNVHYNPEKPAEAVLNVEAGGTRLFLILGIILTSVGVIIGCIGMGIGLVAILQS